jgi:hypothetical protein
VVATLTGTGKIAKNFAMTCGEFGIEVLHALATPHEMVTLSVNNDL